MRQALLLYAAQAHALIKNTAPTRLTKTRAAPQGWEDLSNGKGACCVRRLTPPNKGPKPPPGAECSVRWTAWLAEKQGNWWCRGERIGALQPNSTLEFTLGGGSVEATRAWSRASTSSRISPPTVSGRPSAACRIACHSTHRGARG